jgi:hypothetical protein
VFKPERGLFWLLASVQAASQNKDITLVAKRRAVRQAFRHLRRATAPLRRDGGWRFGQRRGRLGDDFAIIPFITEPYKGMADRVTLLPF